MALLPRFYLGAMTFAWNQVTKLQSETHMTIQQYLFLFLILRTFWPNSFTQVSSPVTEGVAIAMARRAAAAGVRTLDAARIYSGGACEPMVGAALRALAEDG